MRKRFPTLVMDDVRRAIRYRGVFKLAQALSWVALGWWRAH